MQNTINFLLAILYALIGLCMAVAGIETLRDKTRIGTTVFWFFLAIIFAFGDWIPAVVSGAMVLIIGILALFKQIQVGSLPKLDPKTAQEGEKRL